MEFRAEIVHDCDDGNGNPGSYQTVFDGRRPGLVSQELAERRAHGGSVGLSSKASVNWPPLKSSFVAQAIVKYR